MGEHHHDVFEGCERFFRPGYQANLVDAWLPALDGVVPKLEAGALVADVGCGHGASTILMAEAFPSSTFIGFDAHGPSITAARKRAADAGVGDRARFEVATAQDFPGSYDLVCFFDCLHDMGDPLAACAHAARRSSPGERSSSSSPWRAIASRTTSTRSEPPTTGSRPCCARPTRSRKTWATALGAQAGEARLRDIATSAGFTSVRRVAETPFNMVLEVTG